MKKILLTLLILLMTTCFAQAQESPLDYLTDFNGDLIYYPLETEGKQFHAGLGINAISWDKLINLRLEASSAMQTKVIDKVGGGITCSLNRLAEKLNAEWKIEKVYVDIGLLWMFKIESKLKGEPAGLLGVIRIPL